MTESYDEHVDELRRERTAKREQRNKQIRAKREAVTNILTALTTALVSEECYRCGATEDGATIYPFGGILHICHRCAINMALYYLAADATHGTGKEQAMYVGKLHNLPNTPKLSE